MDIASLVFGVLATTGVCVSLVPLLNVANCVSLPAALFGLIFGLGGVLRQAQPERGKRLAVAGLVLSGLALLVGGARFVISLLTTGGIL